MFSLDHKVIGIQFLFSTLLWFVVGGLLALAVRWQLAWPWSEMPIVGRMLFSAEGGQISPEFYTMLFTMHASVMIFFVIIPILAGAFGNFLIPLMIGADDMAFPTLNMLQLLVHVAGLRAAWSAASSSPVVRPRPAGPPTPRYRPSCGGAGSQARANALADRTDLRRRLVDDGLGQLHDHHYPDAGPRHDHVPHADDDLGHVHHRHSASLRSARARRPPGSCNCPTARSARASSSPRG